MTTGLPTIGGGESLGVQTSPTITTTTRLHRHVHHETPSTLITPINSSQTTLHATGIRSIPIRLIQYQVSILLRIRAKLPAALQPWFWVGLWIAMALCSLAIFAVFHTRIFELLEAMATFIKNLGRGGPPLIMLGLFLTSFPPLFGYSSLVTMAGYVYGFGFGLFIAYTSALLGSVTCFYLCRRWFKVQVRTLMAKRQNMKSVVKAVEKRGFKLMLLIRLAPYPFNVMNALLSATHVPLSTFTLATAISLSKLILHVYIGSTLSSLAPLPPPIPSDGNGGTVPEETNTHGRNLKIVVIIISMLLGIGVGGYVWIVAKREIEASEDIRTERRRKRRESMRRSRTMRSSNRASGTAVAAGRGTAVSGRHLMARNGSDGRIEQERVPSLDLGGGSDFVGGAIAMEEYQEYEEGQEDQSLVGNHYHRRSVSPSATSFEYGSDSEVSDFMDDDEDMSDMERGVDDDDGPLLHNATEMNARSTGQHQGSRRSEDDRRGWFEQNGVDISDRGW
ncbi:hypothetical protein BGX27_003108 [Mortierella sp. AM989]|nr:hypothetical protein BGX27_003108 [Mortierella sp. AM989]